MPFSTRRLPSCRLGRDAGALQAPRDREGRVQSSAPALPSCEPRSWGPASSTSTCKPPEYEGPHDCTCPSVMWAMLLGFCSAS